MKRRTYGAIHWDGTAWVIPEIEPHVVLKLKAIFPRIPRLARKPFTLAGGHQVDADLRWFLTRYPLKISDADEARMEERKALFEIEQAELSTILADDWEPSAHIAFRGDRKPYKYQQQAAEFARRTGRLLLMDDLGLGKTISGCAAICDPEYLPALVVPQTHLVTQWADQIRLFTNMSVHVIKGTKPYELPRADVYICPYSRLAGWIDYAEQAKFKAVVFDEMQELRHGKNTAKGKAAKAYCDQAKLRIGLTATPIYNYGSEIFNVVNFLEEGALGEWVDFTTEWCDSDGSGKWVVEDPQALGTFLREQNLALRRSNEDVGNEFPPLNVITHTIPFDEEVLAADEAFIRGLAKRVIEGETFTERGQAAREFDLRLRHATGVAKAPHVAAFVRILLEARQPVLLCGWHRDVYDIWQRELAQFNPVLFTGSETPKMKERTKEAFVTGASNLMIMSLRSGAGLDGLQYRAHTIVFGELDWSPQVHSQCSGRLRRPGQTRQVDAIYLQADGGSDPSVVSVLGLKASQSHGIVDPLSAPADQYSDGSRIRQLAELYLAGKSDLATPAPQPLPAITRPVQANLF